MNYLLILEKRAIDEIGAELAGEGRATTNFEMCVKSFAPTVPPPGVTLTLRHAARFRLAPNLKLSSPLSTLVTVHADGEIPVRLKLLSSGAPHWVHITPQEEKPIFRTDERLVWPFCRSQRRR